MSGSRPIRAVVAEDVATQRKLLVGMLADHPEIAVVAEAPNGADAVEAIRAHQPDLLFLDIQMPELDAFQVIGAIGLDRVPLTIFVTAYDAYALRAFDVHAADYLLKPFDEERLARAVQHAVGLIRDRRRGQGGDAPSADLAALLRALQQPRPAAAIAPISIRVGERFVFLDPARIEWVEASGKSVILHVGAQTVTTRESIGAFARRLDPVRFVQVHRSAIVNVTCIREMQPWFKGDYVITLRDGARITSGRSFREAVRGLLGR